jgi:hypothetical protein
MKAYRGRRVVASLILNLGTRWRWAVNFPRAGLDVLEKINISYPSLDSNPWSSEPLA